MSLTLTRGDTGKFIVTCTKPVVPPTIGPTPPPAPADLTGCTLTWTATNAAGAVVVQHSTMDGGVAVQVPASAGLAIVTVQPTDTSSLAVPQALTYRWVLLDALGIRTTLETGSLLVTP